MAVLIEAAVESLAGALAAVDGGAHRLELCLDLAHGGITPGFQLLRDVRARVAVPVFVLVRPRAGDFVYSSAEHRTMVEQVGHARSAGADGIVTGALTAEGTIAESRLWELLGAAPGLPFTFHRAFDACRDPAASLETLMHLGVKRVLTSGGGGAATAAHGAGNIRALVDQASGRIGILAGGGVTPENVAQLVRATGVTEVHFSVREAEKVRRALAAVREL